ncbi:MAG: type I-E CRISPR-associated protein Cse1/CasA, partial [Anaerolineales bacterium]|nr:type I-E CRISPR-associated protein Cse1/CasA [Anaerolineales bacterium]
MKQSFNLLKEPWIPCIRGDGNPVELSLRETLARANSLRELHGESPLVIAALYRLLLAVLHRVFGPADHEAWYELWRAGKFDMAPLDAYLSQWESRFDLFDPEHPFYQAADDRVKPKPVGSLVHEVASGNNATLFDHHTDSDSILLSPPGAARTLLAAQAFGLAGLSGLEQKFTDAPCARGIVFLIHGYNLFETLLLNLIAYPNDVFFVTRSSDLPSWELDDPHLPDRNWPSGYLDFLTWQNRRVLFFPEQVSGRT